MTATYDSFALEEILRRSPDDATAALLRMAAKGRVGAMALITRRTGADLVHHHGMVAAVFDDRECQWSGDTLTVSQVLPDTVTSLLVGRRIHEVVDVAAGGHLTIRHVRVSDKGTHLICADHPTQAPRVGLWALMQAHLLLAHAFIAAYAGMMNERRGTFMLLYLMFFIMLLHLVLLTADALHPPTIVTAILMAIVAAPLVAMVAMPPEGWRSEMVWRMRRG